MKLINKKYIVIGLILLLVCIFSAGAAFFANECIKNSINDIFKWISGLSSLITLTLALLLFDKYGLNKKVKERTQDIVLELLDKLSEFVINVQTNGNEGSITFYSYYLTSGETLQNDKVLLFRENYPLEICKLAKYSKNYWMPKSIKNKLAIACNYGLIIDFTINPLDKKYARINLSNNTTTNTTIDDNSIKFGYMYIPHMNENFFNNWAELHNSIIEWLNKNADFKLNND